MRDLRLLRNIAAFDAQLPRYEVLISFAQNLADKAGRADLVLQGDLLLDATAEIGERINEDDALDVDAFQREIDTFNGAVEAYAGTVMQAANAYRPH